MQNAMCVSEGLGVFKWGNAYANGAFIWGREDGRIWVFWKPVGFTTWRFGPASLRFPFFGSYYEFEKTDF